MASNQQAHANSHGKLQGKVAVVTGASKGIGASIAWHLAQAGAGVVINYTSDEAGAQRVVSEITAAGGRAIAVGANVAEPADVKRLFSETEREFGRIDVLVNNAGVYQFHPLEDVTPELFHRMFDVNVLGLLLATKEAVRYLGAGGGSVINISSVAATSAPSSASVYSATKGAVDTITRSLAKELGPRKIRVNSLNPGMVVTEGARTVGVIDSEFHKQVESQTPLGRIGLPHDIAPAAVFLASEDASWITGETLHISGGFR